MAKFGYNQYWKPTPRNYRKIADGLLAFSLFVTGYAVLMEVKWLALICIIIGGLGKFGLNFYAEE